MTSIAPSEAPTTERIIDEQGEFDWTSHLTTVAFGPSTALCGKKLLGIPADNDTKTCKKCIRVYEERYGTFFPWKIR